MVVEQEVEGVERDVRAASAGGADAESELRPHLEFFELGHAASLLTRHPARARLHRQCRVRPRRRGRPTLGIAPVSSRRKSRDGPISIEFKPPLQIDADVADLRCAGRVLVVVDRLNAGLVVELQLDAGAEVARLGDAGRRRSGARSRRCACRSRAAARCGCCARSSCSRCGSRRSAAAPGAPRARRR